MSRLLLQRACGASRPIRWKEYAASCRSSRYLTTTTSSGTGERLRVAVVGGGCAGLSTALHLAPLVDAGLINAPIDVYDTALGTKDRDIGVGIWSTALDPFRESDRSSHQFVYKEFCEHGSWLGDVGYRTPAGAWLTKSHLPTSLRKCQETGMPALLFLREKDMLNCLQKAIHWEEQRGTVRVHRDGDKSRINGLYEESSQPWSAQLMMQNGEKTERDYHLIVAADGTHSSLRKTYGGHENVRRILTGTYALPSPIDLPSGGASSMENQSPWDESRQKEAVRLQDRGYSVFRGNAKLAMDHDGDISFQTWGEGRSMRFATVPMFYPGPAGKREERHVWFITTDDHDVTAEPDPVKRQAMLLDMFQDWHPEIGEIVSATPPEEILMERAVAHMHCAAPVLNTNKVIQQMHGRRPPNSGEGPCIVFMGDAYMTIDPILAQGFTVAMEGAAVLSKSVKESCVPFEADPSFAFDPYILRKNLQERNDKRTDRVVCLLRATELVQALGQPTGAAGAFNTKVLRPLTRLLPNVIKAPIFDAVLKYSLGLSQSSAPAQADEKKKKSSVDTPSS